MGSVVGDVGRTLFGATNLIDDFADIGLIASSEGFRDHREVMRRLPVHGGDEFAEFWSLSRLRDLEQLVEVATSWCGWTAAAYSDNGSNGHHEVNEARI